MRTRLPLLLSGLALLGATYVSSASPGRDAAFLRRDVLHRVEWSAGSLGRTSEEHRVSHDFDVLHYDLQLTPNLVAQTLSGVTSITIRSTSAALTTVGLHLHALTVSSVTLGATPLGFTHVGEALAITLDRAYAVDETFTLRVAYAGAPQHESFGGFFFFSDMAFSMGVGLSTMPPSMGRYWFPCFDEPTDKASVTEHYTVPAGKKAVGNGLLTSVVQGPGIVTYTWDEPRLTSTYLIAVAVADWRTVLDPVDPARIYHYVLPGDSVKAVTSFQNVSEMMEAFETRYSPFHYDKLSYVGVRRGDMEHATCVAHLRTLINGNNFYDPILAHELSHHWWGDWVTVGDWRDVWLSEGFATYSEAVYAEHLGGAGAYHAYVDVELLDYYLSSGETFSIYDPDELWGATVYEKGGSVLHMLRHVVGDAAFFDILEAWGAAHGYANALTTDFIEIAETVSGEELSWFFDEWLYGEAYPVYQWSWASTPSASGYVVHLLVDQVQTGALFDMPLDVRITTTAGSSTVTAIVDDASESLSFPVQDLPIDVELDPDRWVLCQKTETTIGVPSSGTPGIGLTVSAPNPFLPATPIRLTVGDPAGSVELAIFDGAGRAVRRFPEQRLSAGTHEIGWDGRDDRGEALPDGLYFMRARQGSAESTQRIVLLR